MRYISAREYAELNDLSLGYVYEMMREGKLPFVEQSKVVKRILWNDEKAVACQPEVVAPQLSEA